MVSDRSFLIRIRGIVIFKIPHYHHVCLKNAVTVTVFWSSEKNLSINSHDSYLQQNTSLSCVSKKRSHSYFGLVKKTSPLIRSGGSTVKYFFEVQWCTVGSSTSNKEVK